jgi:predicted ATPase
MARNSARLAELERMRSARALELHRAALRAAHPAPRGILAMLRRGFAWIIGG